VVSTKVFSDDLQCARRAIELLQQVFGERGTRSEMNVPLVLNLSHNYPGTIKILVDLVGPVGIFELR